jgi:hypothetical protein
MAAHALNAEPAAIETIVRLVVRRPRSGSSPVLGWHDALLADDKQAPRAC